MEMRIDLSKAIKIGRIGILGLSVLVLAGCSGQPDDTAQDNGGDEKRPFFIETTTVGELAEENTIQKSGKIIWAQDITVTSQASWRVSAINGSIGLTVDQWSRVIQLEDSTGTYSIALQRANAAVEQARINYRQTMQGLSQNLGDIELSIQQAQNQAQNSQLGAWSSADFQLQQLQSQLESAQIDLQTKIDSDNQSLRNYKETTKNITDSIKILYDNTIRAWDGILGITDARKFENDRFEDFLALRNTETKRQAERSLRSLLKEYNTLKNFEPALEEDKLQESLETLNWYTEKVIPVLNDIETMLNFTTATQQLPASQLEWFKNSINTLQSQTQNQIATITEQINGIKSFLTSYKQQQESIRKNIQGLESQIASTERQLATADQGSSLSLQTAQNNYQNILETRDTTEASLLNAITQAEIWAREAQNNYSKLTINAPISWTITDIFVDVWQEVSPWSQLFAITSWEQQEIEITLTNAETRLVEEWQTVQVTTDWQTYDAELISIASTANASLGYKAIIQLKNPVSLIWSVATVSIPIDLASITIPLKYIKILNKDQWIIYLWDGNDLEEKTVELWQVWWSTVTIIDETLKEETKIITSSINNYNKNEFILTEKE